MVRRSEPQYRELTIKRIDRLDNTKSGNPRFQFFFNNHGKRRTMPDGQINNVLGGRLDNDLIGQRVVVKLENNKGAEAITGITIDGVDL